LNVRRDSDVRKVEMHAAEPLIPDLVILRLKWLLQSLKSLKLPSNDQILAELIQGEGETYGLRSMNLLILFGIRKNCLISGRSLLLYQFTRKAMKLIIVGYHCYQLHTKFYPIFFSQG
jgi:hypothetical protein